MIRLYRINNGHVSAGFYRRETAYLRGLDESRKEKKLRSTVLALLAALGMPAHAAFTISFEPANPTPADRIVVTIRDSSPTCPTIRARATRFIPPNEIRLEHSRIGDCGFAPFSEARTTIGPLPSGRYVVGLAADSSDIAPPPGPEVTKQLVVSIAGGEKVDESNDTATL